MIDLTMYLRTTGKTQGEGKKLQEKRGYSQNSEETEVKAKSAGGTPDQPEKWLPRQELPATVTECEQDPHPPGKALVAGIREARQPSKVLQIKRLRCILPCWVHKAHHGVHITLATSRKEIEIYKTVLFKRDKS